MESIGPQFSSLIADLSISRAQLVLGQIRQLVESQQIDRLVVLTTSEKTNHHLPLAAAVAVLHRGLERNEISDVATVIHAGRLRDFNGVSQQSVICDLSAELDRQFCQHEIRFAQWATDASDSSSVPMPHCWCEPFGFQQIATLEYLCGSVCNDTDEDSDSVEDRIRDQAKPEPDALLVFHPLSWTNPPSLPHFTKLVEATYTDTCDCPALSRFRTTTQVLDSYRTTEAYAAGLWFRVTDQTGKDVGCAIFATHSSEEATEASPAVGSVEIVYMGLIPGARGKGYGKRLVQKAFDVARDIGADQVLLAVDRANDPAKSIYLRSGLKRMISETVWIKSISVAAPDE